MAGVRTPRLAAIGLLLGALLSVAACGSSATVSPTPAPTGSLASPLTGQTDTEWGRIWDAVPADFPIYPGAVPSEETAAGPVSGVFVVDGRDATTIAAWTADQLVADGYDVNGETAALEDGSYAIDGQREPGCEVHVEVTPLGTLTSILILYGAECPNT